MCYCRITLHTNSQIKFDITQANIEYIKCIREKLSYPCRTQRGQCVGHAVELCAKTAELIDMPFGNSREWAQ